MRASCRGRLQTQSQYVVKAKMYGCEFYAQTKEHGFQSRSAAEWARLRRVQAELEAETGNAALLGLSLADTLRQCVRLGNHRAAARLRADFKVSDRRFWWLKASAAPPASSVAESIPCWPHGFSAAAAAERCPVRANTSSLKSLCWCGCAAEDACGGKGLGGAGGVCAREEVAHWHRALRGSRQAARRARRHRLPVSAVPSLTLHHPITNNML